MTNIPVPGAKEAPKKKTEVSFQVNECLVIKGMYFRVIGCNPPHLVLQTMNAVEVKLLMEEFARRAEAEAKKKSEEPGAAPVITEIPEGSQDGPKEEGPKSA